MNTEIAWPNGSRAELLSVAYDKRGKHEVWRLYPANQQPFDWEKFVFPELDPPPRAA